MYERCCCCCCQKNTKMTAFHNSSSWIVITERKWIVLLGIIETREVLHTMSSLELLERLYSLVLFPQNNGLWYPRVKGPPIFGRGLELSVTIIFRVQNRTPLLSPYNKNQKLALDDGHGDQSPTNNDVHSNDNAPHHSNSSSIIPTM